MAGNQPINQMSGEEYFAVGLLSLFFWLFLGSFHQKFTTFVAVKSISFAHSAIIRGLVQKMLSIKRVLLLSFLVWGALLATAQVVEVPNPDFSYARAHTHQAQAHSHQTTAEKYHIKLQNILIHYENNIATPR